MFSMSSTATFARLWQRVIHGMSWGLLVLGACYMTYILVEVLSWVQVEIRPPH